MLARIGIWGAGTNPCRRCKIDKTELMPRTLMCWC